MPSNVSVVAVPDSLDVIGAAVEAVRLAMVPTDPRQDDTPITSVSAAVEATTRESREFAAGGPVPPDCATGRRGAVAGATVVRTRSGAERRVGPAGHRRAARLCERLKRRCR